MSNVILETKGLTKNFGGLLAVDDLCLKVRERQVHAIIGPNGAGKSTVSNLISGVLAPTSGKVIFQGRDIAGRSSNRISQLGIGRSFQRTNIFPMFTCIENCSLAAQSRLTHSFRLFRRCESYVNVREKAVNALELCGLSHRRDTVASAMSYGEQRQLEIGMVLATEPCFLVLDEPMAGMGNQESTRVVELLRELSKNYGIIWIEHDMDAVFSLADELTVMLNGRVLASGPTEAVRCDPAVQEAYLGDGEGEF
ncbi:MAG: ABC transporter ATP-binding protein [Thalassospira sp.]|nr:ABC transporter ATP-binding protein [Thalassospira sp.]